MQDITALFFEGDECELAKKEYNAKDLYKFQINLWLAVTNEKFSVTHEFLK